MGTYRNRLTDRLGGVELEPVAETEHCTPLSVVAHGLYEKSRPDRLAGPGRVADLTEARYELHSDQLVRVSGAVFDRMPYTVKVEGARRRSQSSLPPARRAIPC